MELITLGSERVKRFFSYGFCGYLAAVDSNQFYIFLQSLSLVRPLISLLQTSKTVSR